MNGMKLRGRWNQLRGEFRKRWCGMTGDRSGRIGGHMLKLRGKMQFRLGCVKESAGRRLRAVAR